MVNYQTLNADMVHGNAMAPAFVWPDHMCRCIAHMNMLTQLVHEQCTHAWKYLILKVIEVGARPHQPLPQHDSSSKTPKLATVARVVARFFTASWQ